MEETPAWNCSMVLSNNHCLFERPSLQQYNWPPRYNWNIVERFALNTITPPPPFDCFNFPHGCYFFLWCFVFIWWCLTPFSTIFQLQSISWRSVLLVEETEYPEKTTDLSQCHWQTISHNGVSVHLTISGTFIFLWC